MPPFLFLCEPPLGFRGTAGREANHDLLAVKTTWGKRLILATAVLTQLTGAHDAIALVLLAMDPQRS